MNQKTVLLVEDHAHILRLLADILNNEDFNVTTCSSGKEAAEILGNSVFDIVITDLRMANGDGFGLLEFIENLNQAENRRQLVMVITGGSPLETPADLAAYKLRDYPILYKPFTKQEFLEEVNKSLEKHQEDKNE